jgi:hypothetical protein
MSKNNKRITVFEVGLVIVLSLAWFIGIELKNALLVGFDSNSRAIAHALFVCAVTGFYIYLVKRNDGR